MPSYSEYKLIEALELVTRYGGLRKAARASGINRSTLSDRLQEARRRFGEGVPASAPPKVEVIRSVSADSLKRALPRRHLIIPDTQIRADVPTDHLHWIGLAIVEYRPDVIVHLGDHWDFASLNSHEKPGSAPLENRRYQDDVKSGNDGFELLCRPMEEEYRRSGWRPEKHYLMGNHDIRPDRVASDEPRLIGTLTSDHCNTRDWIRHPYLEIATIDDILYSHFFQSSHSNRAIGGSIPNKISKIGSSFCHGHVQGLDMGTKMMANGKTLWGASCGSAYLHEEPYRGAQGQKHFRGILVFNEVSGGEFCPMVLSLDYLCRKYTGHSAQQYMAQKYVGQSWGHL